MCYTSVYGSTDISWGHLLVRRKKIYVSKIKMPKRYYKTCRGTLR